MEAIEAEKRCKKWVEEFLNRNIHKVSNSVDPIHFLTDLDHVVECGASMLLHKYQIRPGGNFVEAVMNNDLSTAAGAADYINARYLFIYAMLRYNAPGMISDLS